MEKIVNKFNINDEVVVDGKTDNVYTVKGMACGTRWNKQTDKDDEAIYYKLNDKGNNDIFPAMEHVFESRMSKA